MSKQEQIADFLDKHVTGLPRCHGPYRWYLSQGYVWDTSRESAQEIAEQFLAIAEFRSLQLGTWLGTAEGQIFIEAVEMVVPGFYVEDVDLLVEALRVAAELQQQRSQRRVLAGAALTCAVIVFGLAA
jgi:hypothetical protein